MPNSQKTALKTQAWLRHTIYEPTDVLILYSVLTEKEKAIVDAEYERLKNGGTPDEHVINALFLTECVIIDTSARRNS